MSKPLRRLGRGLDSLVSKQPPLHEPAKPGSLGQRHETSTKTPDIESSLATATRTSMVAIDALRPNPFQPRGTITANSVASLAESLKRSGFVQPISVRPATDGFEIIAGERRWLAARSIGLTHVPVLIRQAGEVEMIELALIENIQREDLNAIERATAYKRFCEEFDLSAEEVSLRLGEDRTTVVNYVRLLDLSPEVRSMVAEGKLSMGHARCLLGVADQERRLKLAISAIRSQLSVRALEDLVRGEKARAGSVPSKGKAIWRQKSAHVSEMERRFEERLKTKVTIEEGKRKGAGRIVIEYFTLDDFERITETLGVETE